MRPACLVPRLHNFLTSRGRSDVGSFLYAAHAHSPGLSGPVYPLTFSMLTVQIALTVCRYKFLPCCPLFPLFCFFDQPILRILTVLHCIVFSASASTSARLFQSTQTQVPTHTHALHPLKAHSVLIQTFLRSYKALTSLTLSRSHHTSAMASRGQSSSAGQDKAWGCPDCDYKSNRSTDVRRHQRSAHTDPSIKAYNCPRCIYGCNQESHCKTHFRTQHSGEVARIYWCPLCSYHHGDVSLIPSCLLIRASTNLIRSSAQFY